MALDLSTHPCFNDAARHTFGRIHLPVAPKCNIQCRFCNRKHDCVNESRPGVSSVVLTPGQALVYLEKALERDPRIRVVGIAGPGDPFANPEATMATLRMVRERYPEMLLCVATNGLNLPEHAKELAELNVSHVTVTVNAVNPQIGAEVYAWVRLDKHTYRGVSAAEILLERQMEGIRLLKEYGVTVKVNTILVPGVNDDHVVEVAKKVSELGADILNCIPIYPVADCEWGAVPAPAPELVESVRKAAQEYMPQMHHCTRCRADAVGVLGEAMGCSQMDLLKACASMARKPEENRPYIAVASLEGVLVNQHLGEAAYLWIFGKDLTSDFGFHQTIDTRKTPDPGTGKRRWEDMADILKDCRAVLVSGAGQAPRTVLEESGIKVIEMEGLIEPALAAVYAGEEIRQPKWTRKPCGVGCGGNGMGCS